MPRRLTHIARTALLVGVVLGWSVEGRAQERFDRTRDRGEGVPSSIFGTYISEGQLLVYPFFEYYRDNDFEYEAFELGFDDKTERRGRYRGSEGLIFLGYGVSKDVALELEVASISASLEKSPLDTSRMPDRIEESGLGDVAAQVRWRWRDETDTAPELFSYAETVFPLQDKTSLIGTSEWEFAFGLGVVRGFRWGTVTARAALGTSGAALEPGEYAVEYLRRVSSWLRVFGAVEGSEDEVELITEAQLFVTRNVFVKVNNAFGLTSKAPDWAPEIGVMMSVPLR